MVAAGLVFGAATAVSAVVPNTVVVVIALVPAGMAWLCMLATMNGNLSMFLPGWVRARGLSIYQMVFAGGQALAAIAWGVSAQWLGLVPTLLAAAVLLGLGAVSVGSGHSATSADWIVIPPSSGRSRSWRSTPNRRMARCW